MVLDACCTNTGPDWTGLDAGVLIGTGLNMVKTGPGLLVFDLLKIMTHSSKQDGQVTFTGQDLTLCPSMECTARM